MRIALAAPREASTATREAETKPAFRPMRFIVRAAGTENSPMPSIMHAKGRVSSFGEGASCPPTMPPSMVTMGGPAMASICTMLKR